MPAPYFAHPYNDYNLEKVEEAYRKASDGRLKERLLMVLLSLEGKKADEIAEITHRCRDTVLKWLHRWNEEGFNGLKDKPYSGRPPILTESEVQKMLQWVCEKAYSGGRLTCKQIALWVKETQNKVIDDESIRRILHQNGFSWKKPQARDHRADPEAQAEFMKELEERMESESDTRFFFSMK